MASGRLQTTVEPALPASMPSLSFYYFPELPYELRRLIWRHSFVPRCVEIHTSHYTNDFQHRGVQKRQSRCNNPAALSVSSEARSAALEFYPIKLRLATIAPYKHASDRINNFNRVLYINFTVDTVVLLSEKSRIFADLGYLKRNGLKGNCLQRLAISASWTYAKKDRHTVREFINHTFPDLYQMTVFIYDEKMRPTDGTSGVCALEDCSQTDCYKQDAIERCEQIRKHVKWMAIGKKQVRVMKLTFRHGW